jgi:maltooligosyltrehalose trehalohydrolase
MGEEYGETAPFLYFTNHNDPHLGKSVREGRGAEFPGFHADGDVPDPQSEATFFSSKLDHGLQQSPQHRTLLNFYRELLRLRRTVPALSELDDCEVRVSSSDPDGFLCVQRSFKTHKLAILFNFGNKSVNCSEHFISGTWQRILDSSESKWMGPGTTMPELFTAPTQPRLEVQPKSLCVVEQVP